LVSFLILSIAKNNLLIGEKDNLSNPFHRKIHRK